MHEMLAKPLKLGVVAIQFPLVSETFVIDQLLAQRDRGFQTSIITDVICSEDLEAVHRPEIVHLVKTATRRRWDVPFDLKAAVRRLPSPAQRLLGSGLDAVFDRQLRDQDVLLAHFGQTGARIARSRSMGRLKTPFATIFHGNDVAIPLKLGRLSQYRQLFRQGDLLLPVSAFFADILIAAGADPAKVKVHRTGVDCEAIPFRERRERDGPLRIVTTCRLVEKKGIAYAIDSLRLLSDRRPDIAWRYDVWGDGPLLKDLEARVQRSQLGGRVRFHGSAAHEVVKAQLAQADAFLLPSVTAANGDMEGVPVAIMEAMAAGLPVISTLHSGIPELVEDGQTGMLAPERDADSLSRCIERLADAPERVAAMTAAARRKVVSEFDQASLNDALAAMLRELARRSRRDGAPGL